MKTLADQAATTFNRVMANQAVDIHTFPADFSIGQKCTLPALNQRGERLSNQLFDLLFPRLESGTYYHYLTLDAFEKVVEHGSLRFFSTKKLSSDGEFIPLCQDLELDGYWRIGADGKPEGEHTTLMDDLFYKSFVSCPETNAEELWDTFAGHGTGVRIAVRIDVHPEYPDFRRVSYQDSNSVVVLKDLLKAFRGLGRHFIPFGISRMPAYHQLKKYAYQNECRLIAKRHPDAHDCFPFQVGRDESQQCNYIDCSLQFPTCSQFQIHLLDVDGGPSCDIRRLHQTLDKQRFWDQHRMNDLIEEQNREIAGDVLKTTPGLAEELIKLYMSGEPNYENGQMGLPTDGELEGMLLRRSTRVDNPEHQL